MKAARNRLSRGRTVSVKRLANRPFSFAVVLFCIVSASTALADLLYTFDGTSIDTNTWRLTRASSISQNNALFLTGASNPGYPAQLTTKDVELGIGGSAQVQITITDHTSQNFVPCGWLGLTTDDTKTTVFFDSYAVSTELDITPASIPGYSAAYFYGGGYGTGVAQSFPVALDTVYSLRLERLTDTSVRYTVLDSANSIIAQNTRTLPSFTSPLYVAIGSVSVDATFDNLQLSGNIIFVPEPSAALLLAVGVAAALWREIQVVSYSEKRNRLR